MSRPSKYQHDFAKQAEQLCTLGATDSMLANFFEVSTTTIDNWKNAHPEFLGSLKRGKLEADLKVANSLYSRACGAEWVEQQAFKVRRVEYENGKRLLEVETIETVDVLKRTAPDTTACIFWLKNRQPAEWRSVQPVQSPQFSYDVTQLTDLELKRIIAGEDPFMVLTETRRGMARIERERASVRPRLD